MASCTDAASNDESTAEDVKSDSEDDCLDADSIGRSYDADLMREMEVVEHTLDEEEHCTSQAETVSLLKLAALSHKATLSSATLSQESAVEPTQVTSDQLDNERSAADMSFSVFAPSTYAAYEEVSLSQVSLGDINISEQSQLIIEEKPEADASGEHDRATTSKSELCCSRTRCSIELTSPLSRQL
ncbi:hypothetical protein L914_07170 [Phytophthora nicotianae]|uniref:Uncharacterized protein n=2 Tax=Phytophthora nicotianae TaxID=4792 RepID=W2NK12_PHYNI|nr:hypothetical protein L914_07170 [Phytophthora nicotianae]ETO77304.1 hypothetical protein F444_07470 [Phytophthora nicotianae P1976]